MAAKVLDRSAATVPRPLLEAVVEHYDPVEVILFGSRARGDAGLDSDWDLLVVTDDAAAGRPLERPPIWPADATVIPCSRSGFEHDRDLVGTLANMADEYGLVVWRRQGVPAAVGGRRRSVTPEERWRVAERWLARAEHDLEAARILLPLGEGQLDNAAFHLQQAAEKVLKCILAGGGRHFRKVHGLGELASWASEMHPDLAADLAADLGELDPYTSWVAAGRYPDARTRVPITRATVETLLARCVGLLGRARALAPADKG
ncbi:MAG TPA: HEPN domain-containing protein [Geminicoccaceae bacterium]|nr:HEPN domain-containing protein [Geminicoccaceae bacterium]